MNRFLKLLSVLLFTAMLFSCREAYISPVDVASQNLLVVEGLLNSGNEPTVISLSRTLKLHDTLQELPENGAFVSVEGEDGATWNLTPIGRGQYYIFRLPLNTDKKYRLLIRTSNGQQYESDFVPVLPAPEIDSITWQQKNQDVEIMVNTHDNTNNTRYYRWDYDETWEFHSVYLSDFYFDVFNVEMYDRINNREIYYCWKTLSSSEILLGSTAKQADDILRNYKLKTIKYGDERLAVRYSINMRQYALTQTAFEYWQTMKKNTESMGTIFDPQPSVNVSNIRNTNNPDEMVIGYISAGATTSSRKFIERSEIDWYYWRECYEIRVPNIKDSLLIYFGTGDMTPTYAVYHELNPDLVIAYYGSKSVCVDCTLSASSVRPSFW